MSNQEIFTIFLSILIGICAYFLGKFYDKVEEMGNDIKQIMISDARTEQKIVTLEDDVTEIKDNWKGFKQKYKLD